MSVVRFDEVRIGERFRVADCMYAKKTEDEAVFTTAVGLERTVKFVPYNMVEVDTENTFARERHPNKED